MKLAGFLLLLAGWLIVLSAVVLLGTGPARVIFVLAGIALEMAGLGIEFRCHRLRQDG